MGPYYITKFIKNISGQGGKQWRVRFGKQINLTFLFRLKGFIFFIISQFDWFVNFKNIKIFEITLNYFLGKLFGCLSHSANRSLRCFFSTFLSFFSFPSIICVGDTSGNYRSRNCSSIFLNIRTASSITDSSLRAFNYRLCWTTRGLRR